MSNPNGNQSRLTEEETRSRLIRPAIVDAGWEDHQIREEYPYTMGRIHVSGRQTRRGEQRRVDFLLEYKPHMPLAVVEAKSSQKDLGKGMQQALEYAEALDVPFVLSANGKGFLLHDRTGQSDPIETELDSDSFPTPEALYAKFRAWKGEDETLHEAIDQPYHSDDPNKTPRYFQRIAINRTVEAIASAKKRLLLVMATGTGKTFVASQIIWRLWKSGQAKRVLFLADRNILIDQARGNDFKQFGNALTKIQRQDFNQLGDLKAYQIFLGLYQAMSGAAEDEKLYKQLPPDFFDVIIVDECHRGSADQNSEWREILDYFGSATHLGLTATPKETKDVSTEHYFGEPIYTYSLKQGIDDGFLAPYKVLRVVLDNDVTGWRPAPGTIDDDGNEVPDKVYELKDVNRAVVFPQRDKLVADRIIEYMNAIEDPYAKTIVFCRTIKHAERMRSALVNAAGQLATDNRKYVMKITGDDEIGKQHLDLFINPNERYPVIVTTSQLLSTGVDAQTCKLIVLDKPIESMTEFKQIIGRGTRVREDKGKMWFTIMDFQGVTKLFADPEFDGVPDRVFEVGEDDDIADIIETIDPDDGIEIKEMEDEFIDTIISCGPMGEITDRPPVYTLSGVPYAVVKEQVRYLDGQGQLMTESLTDFTKKNILDRYPTLDDFFTAWRETDRRQAIIDEIEKTGIPLEELRAQLGDEIDLFDLIMHVAYDKKPMKRIERVAALKDTDYLEQYKDDARAVIEALLDKYMDIGYVAIDEIESLRTPPLSELGAPLEIMDLFGGQEGFMQEMDKLGDALVEVKR